jgi:hypothetical protein
MHVDNLRREILMYFHCPAGRPGQVEIDEQKTFLATSRDGLRFSSGTAPLGPAYFRVFRRGNYYYALVRGGLLLRSKNLRSAFEPGPTLIPPDRRRMLRHAAVDVKGDTLRVYYSRIGDRPERILLSEVRMSGDWSSWRGSEPLTVLGPEKDYEGADRPFDVSQPDEAPGRVRQLRDPAIFREDGKTYLLYSIAGESGIAVAELRE